MMVDPPGGISRLRIILAGLIGNVVEWYDFAVYGYFATVLGRLYFPSSDPALSVVAAFGAFAAGFLMRPIGGLLFGRIGDRIGRRPALRYSVLAMALPTVLIACLPTHQQIGIAAPIAIVLLRMIQGLSVGGEYTSSMVYLVEQAPPGRRAFLATWGVWGAVLGVLLGSAIGALLTGHLSGGQVDRWGWRVAFLLGGIVAFAGLIIRRRDRTDTQAGGLPSQRPIQGAFGRHRWAVVRIFLLNIGNGTAFYSAFVYAVTYMQEVDHLPESLALNLNSRMLVVFLLLLPLSACLSDRLGRKPLMLAGASMLVFGAIPFYALLQNPDPRSLWLGELGFVMATVLLTGGICPANVELMPQEVRCTGLSLGYNMAIALFGGTTPLISAWAVAVSGNPGAPATWVVATALVTLLTALVWVKESRHGDSVRCVP